MLCTGSAGTPLQPSSSAARAVWCAAGDAVGGHVPAACCPTERLALLSRATAVRRRRAVLVVFATDHPEATARVYENNGRDRGWPAANAGEGGRRSLPGRPSEHSAPLESTCLEARAPITTTQRSPFAPGPMFGRFSESAFRKTSMCAGV